MKNLNFKPKTIYGLCLAGSLFLAASISSSHAFQKDLESHERSNQQSQQGTNDDEDDRQFMAEAAKMNMNEIALAKLAQEKDVSEEIKALANILENDHEKAMTNLSNLAQKKNIPLDTAQSAQKSEEMTRLESLNGEEFGDAYTALLAEKHKKAVEKFEKASQDAQDPEIRAWASGQLPVLQSHLEKVTHTKMKHSQNTGAHEIGDRNQQNGNMNESTTPENTRNLPEKSNEHRP